MDPCRPRVALAHEQVAAVGAPLPQVVARPEAGDRARRAARRPGRCSPRLRGARRRPCGPSGETSQQPMPSGVIGRGAAPPHVHEPRPQLGRPCSFPVISEASAVAEPGERPRRDPRDCDDARLAGLRRDQSQSARVVVHADAHDPAAVGREAARETLAQPQRRPAVGRAQVGRELRRLEEQQLPSVARQLRCSSIPRARRGCARRSRRGAGPRSRRASCPRSAARARPRATSCRLRKSGRRSRIALAARRGSRPAAPAASCRSAGRPRASRR